MQLSNRSSSSTTEWAFRVRHFPDYLSPCLPFCQRQCAFSVEEAQLFTVSFPVSAFRTVVYVFGGICDAPYCTSDAWKIGLSLVSVIFLALVRKILDCDFGNYSVGNVIVQRILTDSCFDWSWSVLKCLNVWILHKAVFLSAIKSFIFSASTMSLPCFDGAPLAVISMPHSSASSRRYMQTWFL